MTDIDTYIAGKTAWSEGLARFAAIIRSFDELEESLKWGMPYWTLDGAHVVAMPAFKKWIALWFDQGHAMADPLGVLVNASPDKTKYQRQWRIPDPDAVRSEDLKAYIAEAIRVTRDG